VNAAVLLDQGRLLLEQHKRLLPFMTYSTSAVLARLRVSGGGTGRLAAGHHHLRGRLDDKNFGRAGFTKSTRWKS